MVLQRFAAHPVIVSDLVGLDDAPKGEGGRPREEGTLEMAWQAVWGMLYADDAGVVSTSPRGLVRMVDVRNRDVRNSCNISGILTDSVGGKDRDRAPVVRSQHSVERAVN